MARLFDKLLTAQSNDDVETVSRLLKSHRGWPKDPAWSDHALLSEALQFGRKKVANHLLDIRCRVTRPGHLSTFVHTFVHMALKHSDWAELIAKLIKLGAPVSTVNDEGDTAVHVAFKNSADGDLIDLLLQTYVRETTWNTKDSDGLSILHIACSRPNLEIVRALTYRKAQVIVTRKDINGQVESVHGDYSRYTPLHFAVKNGRTDIVKFLTKHFNVDIYQTDDNNSSTPLHLALERNDIQMVDCIFACDKLYTDKVNNMGFSHFMAACAASNSSIAAQYLRVSQLQSKTSLASLINNKVVESSDSPYKGYTALHFAAEFSRLDTVQLLLAHDAPSFVVSSENETPLVVALKRGHDDVSCLLWRKYKAHRQSIYNAIDGNNVASGGNGTALTENNTNKVSPPGFIRLRIPPTTKHGSVEKQLAHKPSRINAANAARFFQKVLDCLDFVEK